jgi:hypothetical protein
MASSMYYVKREGGLFRKGGWHLMFDRTLLGMYPDREAALATAVGEADRLSFMGRASEVWVFEGDGFVLFKAFQAQKPPKEEKNSEGSGHDKDEEAAFIDGDPTFDSTSYTADPSTDATTSY